MKFETDYFSTQ